MDTNLDNIRAGDEVMVECDSGMGTGGIEKVTMLSLENIANEIDGDIILSRENVPTVWCGNRAFSKRTGRALNEPTAYFISHIVSQKPHPVRFSSEQIEFIQHMMHEKGYEFWEDACFDIEETIIKAEHIIKK